MKQMIMFLGMGFVAFQFLLVMALLAAAKRPTPQFEGQTDAQEAFELVS